MGGGGVPTRSQYNQVRQFNNSKLDKYQFGFVILANISGEQNFIYHINMYNSKNVNNKLY